jgi:kojibiose phosphorylase
MKNKFNHLLSKRSWLIQEDAWKRHDITAWESRFAQCNGVVGIRGILEEVPSDSVPGTFIAGLYDKISAQETDLVNLPNPLHFKVSVNGEKLGMGSMDAASHARTLDMRNGILTRHTVFQDSRKKKYDYQSIRFVSMNNENLIVYRIFITPLDQTAQITIRHDIDIGVTNHGVLTEGNKRHFQIANVYQSQNHDYVCVKTHEKGTMIAFASSLICQVGSKEIVTGDPAFDIKLKKGQTACFTKIIALNPSRDPNAGLLERSTQVILSTALNQGFENLLRQHIRSFRAQWTTSDVQVSGTGEIQNAIRFNIYHMLIAGPRRTGEASVGAKTLSGEGYRGHIFWDADIFLVPFFIWTYPQIAKNMLIYRYDRLGPARELAKKNGYKGAQFPWESADSGEETTPKWAKDFDGRIIKVKTGDLEHHIVADVAYTVYKYYAVTGDDDFMVRYGYEMLFETARFWASRVQLNKKRKSYDIRRVIGPDEFHENVNNNAYTNFLARWNLLVAQRMFLKFKREHKLIHAALCKRLNLKIREVNTWGRIGNKIYFNVRPDHVIEQFEGYFKKKRVRITTYDKHGLPDIPVGLDLRKIGTTQFVKQSDVIMLFQLFPKFFKRIAKQRNYEYYITRTLHKSSLSPSVYAAIGNEVGDQERAYGLFLAALLVDLEDVRGGLKDGIHGASLGGVWQTVVNGFGGLKLNDKIVVLEPNIPKSWRSLSYSVRWHNMDIHIKTNHRSLEIRTASAPRKLHLPILVNGHLHHLAAGRKYKFRLPQH